MPRSPRWCDGKHRVPGALTVALPKATIQVLKPGQREAVMGWLLCRLGRHAWLHERNPDMGGPGADFERCTRCGRERAGYGQPPATGAAAG
jgi:hypothetical protein